MTDQKLLLSETARAHIAKLRASYPADTLANTFLELVERDAKNVMVSVNDCSIKFLYYYTNFKVESSELVKEEVRLHNGGRQDVLSVLNALDDAIIEDTKTKLQECSCKLK